MRTNDDNIIDNPNDILAHGDKCFHPILA